MKKIMILGAGTYQIPLIKTAKRMGLYTIVVSPDGNYGGFKYADKVYYYDTRDRESILQAAIDENIDGICTSGTDVAVISIGYVCEQMRLNGIPMMAAQILTDKVLMKEAFINGNVSTSLGKAVFSLGEAITTASDLGYPVVVKCPDSSGNRGIIITPDESEMSESYVLAASSTTKDYVLIERFTNGIEIGVDGFVQNGKLVFLAPHTKFVRKCDKTTVSAGHAFPYTCSKNLYNELYKQIQLAVTASGADNCSVNADVFVDGNSVSIIEMGGRTGATCIPELISEYYGFDFYELILKNALGEDISDYITKAASDVSGQPCMAKLLFSDINGVITNIDAERLDKLREQSKVIDVAIDYPIETQIHAVSNGTDRIGHVIASSSSEYELDVIVSEALKCITIKPL